MNGKHFFSIYFFRKNPICTLQLQQRSAFLTYVKTGTLTTSSFDSELQRGGSQLDSLDNQANRCSATDGSDVNIRDREAFGMPVQ